MMKRISNKNIVWRAAVPFGLLVVIYLTAVSQASAQCSQWSVRIMWGIQQSNNIRVKMDFLQRGVRLGGTASYKGTGGKQESGKISGTLNGDDFYVEIKWDYGETGVYAGKRYDTPTSQGYALHNLSGTAYIKEKPDDKSRKTTWSSIGSLICAPKD